MKQLASIPFNIQSSLLKFILQIPSSRWENRDSESLVTTECHTPREVARLRPVPGRSGSKDHHLLVRFSPISDCNVDRYLNCSQNWKRS